MLLSAKPSMRTPGAMHCRKGSPAGCASNPLRHRQGPPAQRGQHRLTVAQGLGKDALDGWLDVTKLVTGGGTNKKTAFEDLAYSIGRDVYVDLSGWHLYLRDMNAAPGFKMSQVLAQQLGAQVEGGGRISERDVEALLRKVPVQLGGGKLKVSLYDIMPAFCVSDLTRLVEEQARR